MTTLDLYHRTSEDAARAIVATGRFLTRENTPEAYVSTHVDGEAAGYGSAVVHVRVDEADAQLEDEFPDGELHYRIPLDRAEVVLEPGEMAKLGGRPAIPGMPVEVFIRTGERTPLAYLVKPLAEYFNRAFRES